MFTNVYAVRMLKLNPADTSVIYAYTPVDSEEIVMKLFCKNCPRSCTVTMFNLQSAKRNEDHFIAKLDCGANVLECVCRVLGLPDINAWLCDAKQ